MKSFSRIKGFTFTIIAQVLTLLILFGLAEGAFRLLNPDYDLRGRNERGFFCVFDPVLGWVPKKQFTGIHEKNGFAIPVHQNQFGLRAPDSLLMENPEGKRRIIVLGDSYVWGYGVGDNKVFTELGEFRYGAKLINFGVSGYGTDQEYLLYKRSGKNFVADEVILAITPYNDFMNNMATRQYGYDKPYFLLTNDQLHLYTEHMEQKSSKRIKSWLNDSLFAFNYINAVVRNIKQLLESSKKSASAPKQAVLQEGAVTDSDRTAIMLTIRIVDELKKLVESQGRKFKVVFIPYKVHINQSISHNHPMVPLFAEELQKIGVEYLEPFFTFRNRTEKGEGLFNQRDNHFNASGHALFARALLDPDLVKQNRNFYHRDPAQKN